jgi:hypothetical protein
MAIGDGAELEMEKGKEEKWQKNEKNLYIHTLLFNGGWLTQLKSSFVEAKNNSLGDMIFLGRRKFLK